MLDAYPLIRPEDRTRINSPHCSIPCCRNVRRQGSCMCRIVNRAHNFFHCITAGLPVPGTWSPTIDANRVLLGGGNIGSNLFQLVRLCVQTRYWPLGACREVYEVPAGTISSSIYSYPISIIISDSEFPSTQSYLTFSCSSLLYSGFIPDPL
jgi:hypothetical protein